VSLLQWHPTRRNRLGTPDGMSLERSNRTVTERTRKKELIEAMGSLLG